MNRLPTEVWLLIITYLSGEDVKGLLGVDRQLTDIVLNLRYHIAVAAPCFMRRQFFKPCNFVHLSRSLPQVLHKVRELVFKDDPPIVPYKHIGSFHLPLYRVAAAKRLFSPKHWALRQYYRQLLKRVADLENVQIIAFHFTWTFFPGAPNFHQPYVPHKMRIFRALATVRPSQITRLSISTNLRIMIPFWPHDIELPNLKELCFKIQTHNINDLTPIFAFAHPCINKYVSTLEDFTLMPAPYLELKDVLQGIKHMPRLRKFCLCWFLRDTPAERQEVSRFMKEHSSQLAELRLRLIPYHQFDWTLDDVSDPGPIASIDQDVRTLLDSCFNCVFSSLRHLSLYFDGLLPSHVASVRQFLRHHSEQLSSLHLLPTYIRRDGILPPNFMSHFQLDNGHFISFSLLQDLSIYSCAFDIKLISFLATSLPLVRYLCIEGLLSISIPTTSAGFHDLERLLQSWELPDLDLMGEARRWKFNDKLQLAHLFAGAKRICGRLPLEWAKDREVADFLQPLRMRVAPNYYDQDD